MADAAHPASTPASSSTRAKKRSRQKTNQQKRAYAHDALIAFEHNRTFANAFRAWLAHVEETLSPEEHRSAAKFTRAMRSFSSKSSGEPDYTETERISADTLARWVDDLAWSLNVKFTLDENAGKLKTPTARIGNNFRSLIHFLASIHAFTQSDVSYLLDECRALADDLNRTARVNRIMEEYAIYVQEAYFDTGRTVDETYYGEYEVERIAGRRILVLRRYDPDDDSDTSSTSLRSFTTYFPAPLVQIVKRGDTLTLQICHLEQNKAWVPYMYSGFTPSREDAGTSTPTERQIRASSGRSGDDPTAVLQSTLMRLEMSPRRRSENSPSPGSGRHGARSRTPQRVGSGHRPPPPQAPGFDFTFDEAKFTDEYFRAWDGDIDSDEDFSDLVRPPDPALDDEPDSPASGDGSSSSEPCVNLYHALRERHMHS
ncbi:uncharacterized protein FOMMEDRAFT_166360 [Fomitiporia mediterranea MF3/22]|uniref:uncharacterized protein n=1 Tax=Fomitiporia mediterranea (strain MF3/22) TaxID=694068 RepID=UPI0004407A27|nr:uncharacterized protein FOMMEDRAFT_166360 [Fomitiporia mediterranea MF3/22]EJD06075.1 hypothetical protein FOMMEDRAFT_166360 [Fomitiporia mediterranea MF3/22]